MHAGLLSLWVTGALLLNQCLCETDDTYYYEAVTATSEYTDYTDYTFEYESDTHYTTSIDYDLYVTPRKGIKHAQSNLVTEEAVNSGKNQINDEG